MPTQDQPRIPPGYQDLGLSAFYQRSLLDNSELHLQEARVCHLLVSKNLYTTGEIASICQVAPRTVSKWFDSGSLVGHKIPGSKDRRVRREALLDFLSKNGMIEIIPTKIMSPNLLVVDSSKDDNVTHIAIKLTIGEVLKRRIPLVVVGNIFELGRVSEKYCLFPPKVLLINEDACPVDDLGIKSLRDVPYFLNTKIIRIKDQVILQDDGKKATLQNSGALVQRMLSFFPDSLAGV